MFRIRNDSCQRKSDRRFGNSDDATKGVGSGVKSQQWDIMKWFCHVFRRFAACGYIKARLCYKWTFIGRLASTVVKCSFEIDVQI